MKKRVELLSPVGNKEMLYQAIHNGADAVYLSGINYGARKFAHNFTNNELVEAIEYAHLYGVKVYVTVNTLIYEDEVDQVLEYLGFLHQYGVDAVIMQDMGLIRLTRQVYPNLEIHASTQCHNHNREIVKFWKSLGLTRVVLAREMSLPEIEAIDVEIEKEVFVYGALCVCYSGCCLFSSLNGGRSGNRGECVGSCRLPYRLIKNNEIVKTEGDFLLSTKDLNTLNHLEELLESGIDSFKIEGRMKSPAYVGYVTRLYRMLIDKYYRKEKLVLTKVEMDNLKKLFNREFTDGYLFQNRDIMNIKTPNHQGIEVGKVIGVLKNKIKVKLTGDGLSQNDGIRFKFKDAGMMINRLYNDRGLLVNSVSLGNICLLDNRLQIKVGDIVLKTIDSKLNQELVDIEPKKILVSMDMKCFVGKRLELTVTDGIYTCTCYGDIVELAKSRDVSLEEIKRQLSKLGNTPFHLHGINILKDDNIFIHLREINEIRRSAVDELIALRKKNRGMYLKNTYSEVYEDIENSSNICLNVLVRNEEQLKVCLEEKVNNIYVTDYDLYERYKQYKQVYYRLDRVMNDYPDYCGERLLVGELGSVYRYYHHNVLVGDYYLNVTNHYSLKLLRDYGVKRVTLSVELSDYQIKDILQYSNQVELIIYGRLELMVMKSCLLKKGLQFCGSCQNSQDKFYLSDKFHHQYPIIRNHCFNHLMHYQVMDKMDDIHLYRDMGIYSYRLELLDESGYELMYLIHKFYQNLVI